MLTWLFLIYLFFYVFLFSHLFGFLFLSNTQKHQQPWTQSLGSTGESVCFAPSVGCKMGYRKRAQPRARQRGKGHGRPARWSPPDGSPGNKATVQSSTLRLTAMTLAMLPQTASSRGRVAANPEVTAGLAGGHLP